MTIDDKVEAFRMKLNGYTYREIADRYGVTRQRIQQIFSSREKGRRDSKNCIYPNLKRWMQDQNHSYHTFSDLVEVAPSTMYRILTGQQEPKKSIIDSILSGTGMTYETTFMKEGVGK